MFSMAQLMISDALGNLTRQYFLMTLQYIKGIPKVLTLVGKDPGYWDLFHDVAHKHRKTPGTAGIAQTLGLSGVRIFSAIDEEVRLYFEFSHFLLFFIYFLYVFSCYF